MKKTYQYAIACPTSMGVRITPPERMAVQNSNLFYMQATSAETNVLNVASSLGHECLALTKFVKGSPVADFIKRQLRARNIRFEGLDVEQGGPWGYRHQFNIADSGFGLRAPRVWNDRAGEVGRTLSIEDFDIERIFGQEGVGILHLSGLIAAMSHETTQCCLALAKAAKQYGTLVSFDLNYRATFWKGREDALSEAFGEIASLADVLIGNEEDFQLCLGFKGPEAGGKDLASKIESFQGMISQVQEQYPNDTDLLGRASIIDESNGRRVRMAWLAVVVSHKVNGVSELHSNLMVQSLFADFAKIFPGRFTNVTNGVTPRRWLAVANPSLSAVLDEHLGRNWRTDLSLLNELQQHCDFPMVNHAVHQAKLENKKRLAEYIAQQLNVVVNPKALFDVQIKRIHEYKRQLMNVLHVITRYNRIKADPDAKWVPRVNIFGGKAASAYYMAKHIIHLINDVAKVINNDPQIGDKLKVVFIPNYSVSLAQLIIPAADLSEQISLAGTEASGTSNMKFALNGALTIGTLDGANVEMLDHVGADNIFIFGNTAEEVEELRRQGYKPREYYEKDEELHQVLTQIGSGVFSPEDPGRYRDLVDSLINFGDHYQVLADYRSYVDCQDKVDELYELQEEWTAKAMLNIANMGYFSSDRTIKEYADHIWHIDPVRL